MDLGLLDKTAFVTGASKGLGYATARQLALEGADVAINSRSKDALEAAAQKIAEESGRNIIPIPGDLAAPQTPAALVEAAESALGGLDILVTNAGGPPAGAFESFSEEEWSRAIDLSFLSHVRLIRAALPSLRKSQAASVLTITSYSVKQPIPDLVLSNSIRSATIGLTKTLALELGQDGIRFNSILPGWTETERVYNLMAHRAEKSGNTVEQEIDKQMANSPLGRMASPNEFAKAAVFMVSPAASYITGVMLTVDGGMYKGTL
ncbi:MAG TPA: SDR family oxidoreductase [Anaerolineales bacterium]|nr:SDR family oxidoreductase [Anaerolineales bacterium]